MAEIPFMALEGFLKQDMTSGHVSGISQEPCQSRVKEDPSTPL